MSARSVRSIWLVGAIALAACSTAQVPVASAPTVDAATASQLAAIALEGAYTVAAQAEIAFARAATPAQVAAVKQADAAAYAWVVALRNEAQSTVVASDLTAGQQAVATLSQLVAQVH